MLFRVCTPFARLHVGEAGGTRATGQADRRSEGTLTDGCNAASIRTQAGRVRRSARMDARKWLGRLHRVHVDARG